MNEEAFLKATDDQLEEAFIEDYATFAAQLNPIAITTLLRQANETTDKIQKKQLVTAGLQILYTSIEDFSVLLRAIIDRQQGKHLHQLLSLTDEQGSTSYPKILKNEKANAANILKELGLTSINATTLQTHGYEITEKTLNDPFNDFATSIKNLSTDAENTRTIKNRLKHGKAILGTSYDLNTTSMIGHLEPPKDIDKGPLGMATTEASIEQLQQAAIKTIKLGIRSIDLLGFFTIQYHPATSKQQIKKLHDAAQKISNMAKTAGLKEPGLNV